MPDSLALTITGVGVFFATALARALPRLIHDPQVPFGRFPLEGDSSDAMSHLIMVDLLRRNRCRLITEAPQFLPGRRCDYPLFYHWLLAHLPRHAMERFEWTVSPLVEAGHAVAVTLLTWFVLDRNFHAENALGWSVLVTACFVLSPLLVYRPRRGSFMNPRPFGFLFGHLFVAATVLFTATGDYGWLAIGLPAFAIAASSSKFAVQAMTFITIGFSLLYWSAAPLLVLLAGFMVAVIVTRGYILTVLRGLIRHARGYRKEYVHISASTRLFSAKDISAALRHLVRGRGKAALDAVRRHPLHRLPFSAPWLWPFIVVQVGPEPTAFPELSGALAAWAWAAIVVTLLTSADNLKFLGEAERYMEYALLPLLLVAWLLPAGLGGPWWLAALLVPCVAYFVLRATSDGELYLPSEAMRKVARFVSGLPPKTLASVPGRLVLPLCYTTEHRCLWPLAHIDPGDAQERWVSLFREAIMPLFTPEALSGLHQSFGVDLIIVSKVGTDYARHAYGLNYDFSGYDSIYDDAEFILYKACPRSFSAAPPLANADATS